MMRYLFLVSLLLIAGCAGGGGEDVSSTTIGSTAVAAESSGVTSTTIEPGGPATTSLTTSTVVVSTTSTSTTTSVPNTTTTTRAPSGSTPVATILGPDPLTAYQAEYSTEDGMFGAVVSLVADVSDLDGDVVAIEWFSSDEGYLGSGATLSPRIHTIDSDSSQPTLTLRVTDSEGNVVETSVQVIVWIPSDQ